MAKSPPPDIPVDASGLVAYTPEQSKIVRRYAAFAAAQTWAPAYAARQIGCGATTYNNLLNRKYYTHTYPDYIQAMARVLNRADRRDRAIKDPPYCLIAAAEEVEAVCTLCLDQCDMALVQGPTGSGKTMAATAYATHHVADTILITAHPRFNGQALLRKIAEHELLAWRGLAFDVLFDLIVNHLATRGKPLLIIDD